MLQEKKRKRSNKNKSAIQCMNAFLLRKLIYKCNAYRKLEGLLESEPAATEKYLALLLIMCEERGKL